MKRFPIWSFQAAVTAVLVLAIVSWGSAAHAGPECESGHGAPCVSSHDCATNKVATLCASDTGADAACQVPCVDNGQPNPSACSLGETCVPGVEPRIGGGNTYFCRTSKLSMDLNLLDSCVFHFLEGLAPELTGENECSLVNNLNQMLDQDGNLVFNIFDVDLCVRSFLSEEPCNTATQSCPDHQTFCEHDADCGAGLHCDLDLNKCARQCGLIVDREDRTVTSTLDRKCAGSLKTCDYDSGQCVDADLSDAFCQVDQDCPSGAYCFLGSCQPRCYRSLDCPSSDWFCNQSNQCMPRPVDATQPFNPMAYSVVLAQAEVNLDPVQNAYDIPLLIMDLVTKAQVFDKPNVVFGYRLEVNDYQKMDDKCRQDPSQLPVEVQQDCLISPDEEFITLSNPFGTIHGTGDPSIAISINAGTAASLTPGIYQATLSAIFSNGRRSSATIRYRHPSPSGLYGGRLSVYADGPKNLLGTSNLSMRLYVDDNDANLVEWDDLMKANHVELDKDFHDVTIGYPVLGYVYGSTSMMFNWPAATKDSENRIPVKGIYIPSKKRMRLLGVVDYEASFCRSEIGNCNPAKPNELKVVNSFKRKIRRAIEFIGPFDAQTNRFSGVYRETYWGLAPSTFTLDGGFILNQQGQDETPIALGPLLTNKSTVYFPSAHTFVGAMDKEIADNCPASVKAQFQGSTSDPARQAAAFQAYMAGFNAQGGPIFEQLVRYERLIASALGSLANDQAVRNGTLTLDQFLKGQVRFCEPGESDATSCVEEKNLKCGLAMYQKARLSGWIDASTACMSASSANLFCKDIPGRPLSEEPSDCPATAVEEPALVALQDHNRFYRELVQAHNYEAGAAYRDAFLTLYHAANGDAMDEASAYAQKEAYLRDALEQYDAIQSVDFGGASSNMLFTWPMDCFATRGAAWIKQMHATTTHRMEALMDLVDHRRRVLRNKGQQDFLFAKHVLYQEYLQQVFLMELQRHWEKESFAYAGQSQQLMQLGDQLLAKSKDNRNPLGLHPNRIYFENADLASMNWQNFRNRLTAEMPALRADVQEAIENMKGSLASENAFKHSLVSEEHQIEETIELYCGSDDPLPAACNVSLDHKELESSYVGEDCLFEYSCDDPACDAVIKAFNDGTSGREVACRADSATYKINLEGRERLCVRGRVGALMQERVSLELQREQTTKNVQSLVRQIARQQQLIEESQSKNAALKDYLDKRFSDILSAQNKISAADAALELALYGADALDCLIIVGMSNGTDCPQKSTAAQLKGAAAEVYDAVVDDLKEAQMKTQHAKEIGLLEDSQDRQLMSLRMSLDNLVTDVENHIATYAAVTQQLFNINIQISDGLNQAQSAANRHDETVAETVDALLGADSSSVLLSNRRVSDANARFQKMLIEAYKMTRAFIHRFNLDNQSEAWSNRVYQIVTIQDLEDYIAFLDSVEQSYCGNAGLDCDYVNNGEVFELSMQKQLFPGLHDIVDPNTGNVMTVGQQFHNIITSSAYTKRRARAYGLVSQIEIPFAIWLNDRGEAGGAPQRYMVGPGDCNHIIRGTGASGGTVAVNVIGTRLSQYPTVKYELWRGNTDYVRSCTEKVGQYESKINTYIVGWTPGSSLGQLDSPPSFFTQSGELSACINNRLLGNPATVDSQSSCFRFFARDRSLGAPDYQLVIPQVDGDQRWVLGDGLPANEKPIFEDIVLYVRYNDRPVSGQ